MLKKKILAALLTFTMILTIFAPLTAQAAKTGWNKIDGRWKYYYSASSYYTDTIQCIDDEYYCFDDDGWMQVGWIARYSDWYYAKSNGVLANGWEKVNGKWVYCGIIRICGGTATCFNGTIRWTFNPTFIPMLNRMAPIDYPKEIWKQNSKTSGFYLLKYIAENYRMNGDRDISVKTLLERAPTIPKIEEVKQKRMSANQKIIRPFFKTLDDIDSLYYEFVNAEGKIIPVEKVTKYDVFESGKIRVDYDDYPKHEEREKAKEKRKKKIAEAKEKAMIKALEKKAELEVGLL